MNEANVAVNSAKAWLLAARPQTLTGAATPVFIGLATAYYHLGQLTWLPALLCLLFAFIMQIDANFVNDYFDFKKGTDDDTRLGPKRACAEGWITPQAMRYGIGITTLLACAVGLPLVRYGGWPMVAVGAACVLFCFLYTTWLSYKGWGDVLVLAFFGLVPVSLTFYLQVQRVNAPVLLLALACGVVIDALLIVNNFRDRETDKRAGKITLVVRMGEKIGSQLYLWCGLAGIALGSLAFALLGCPFRAFVLLIYAFFHYQTYKQMKQIWQGRELNRVLGQTARNILFFGLLTCAALVA